MNRSTRSASLKKGDASAPTNDATIALLDDLILPEPIPPLPFEGTGRYNTRRSRSLVTPVAEEETTPLPSAMPEESSSSLSSAPGRKATNIPGFVSKLYRMVNESTSNLIGWGEDGSTFAVSSPEDFSRQVLPLFFKHNNFSSFVRQLNMYGFHKIPHLQQGTMVAAMVSPPESNIWEFSNPNFIRGRPDLLVHVRRKLSKEEEQQKAAQPAIRTAQVLNSATPGNLPEPVQVYESLRAELSALRNQQNAIRSDLLSIQRDNQLLWNENLASRERHAHQQQVIDRILRFLASVFSADGKFVGMGSGASTPNLVREAPVPATKGSRKRPLLIESGTPNLEDPEELRRQVMELIAESGATHSPTPFAAPFDRLKDLQATTRDISNDISIVEDDLDALNPEPKSDVSSSGEFDFSNYLNVQSLE